MPSGQFWHRKEVAFRDVPGTHAGVGAEVGEGVGDAVGFGVGAGVGIAEHSVSPIAPAVHSPMGQATQLEPVLFVAW